MGGAAIAGRRRAVNCRGVASRGAQDRAAQDGSAAVDLAQRFGGRNELLPKRTPETLRRFAETPVARKAINTIKDRVAGMNWRIQPRRGRVLDEEMKARIQVLTETWSSRIPMTASAASRAGAGGHHRRRLRRNGDRLTATIAAAFDAVSRGRGDDPDAGGVERRAGPGALRAGPATGNAASR